MLDEVLITTINTLLNVCSCKREKLEKSRLLTEERMGLVRGLVGLLLIGLLVCSMCYDVKGFDSCEEKLVMSPRPSPPPSSVKLTVVIEGVVYCSSCKLAGYVPSLNASPLKGAKVSLVCSVGNNKASVKANTTTDAHGYFLLPVLNVKPSALKKTCKVAIKLPLWCNKPVVHTKKGSRSESTTATTVTNLGLVLPFKYEKTTKSSTSISIFYTTGFTQFAPEKTSMCPRQYVQNNY